MAEQVLDVIIFGASGFTGKYVIREMLKFWDDGKGGKRRIGLAGRSKKKLEASLSWAAGSNLLPQIPIFEADTSSPESLSALCKRTKLLISCVGPYRKYGEPVVAACVQAGVDYLDITGEPEFMERMEIKYHDLAVENECLVVSACGYDSIPAEEGVLFNTKQFVERGWTPNSVNSYLVLGSKGPAQVRGNFGTYQTAILSLSGSQGLAELRSSAPRRVRPKIPGSPAIKPGTIHWEENSGTWALKLPSADAIIVRRTQAAVARNPEGLPTRSDNAVDSESRKEKWKSLKPAHYGCYLACKHFLQPIFLILMALTWAVLARFSWGVKLLLQYPKFFSLGVFSKDGPTEEGIKASYFQMWFVGKGYSSLPSSPQQKPDKEIVTRISGPEIGYITTPICLVQAALLILDERERLPKGGVLTPGAAFGTTDLQERLQKSGLNFELVGVKNI